MDDIKEYIERGALMAQIKATPWSDYVGSYYGRSLHFDINEIVERQPEADVVEVVRCKDCSWFIAREEGAGDCDMIFGFTGPVSENGYCYCGKRKDGADNAAD